MSNPQIRRALERFNVPPPAQDDAIPELPEDVTELDGPGLMILYRKLVAWAEFADQIFADASASEAKMKKFVEWAEAETTATSQQRTVSGRRAEAAVSKAVRDAVGEELLAYHNRKRAEAASKLVERRLSLVSREITRRSASVRERL